ncbi:MAG: viologen exporter family transport system permease protein [Actinomycetota bacterium]|jgi:ABC-2 type transport system permease protein|nr:viologen exporter family transport system permease protein [Actinomycetota bacterium]
MRAIATTMKTALIEAWTNRKSFWLQVSFMIANDLAIVVFWLLFFRKVGTVRGWDTGHVLVLFGVLANVTGIAMGILANARRLGQMVADGELDAVLALPVDPLLYLLVRRVDTALLGDLVFGPLIFVASGHVTAESSVVFVVASLCAAAFFVSFLVILGSVTLFIGGRGEQAELGFQALLMLASYPIDLFGGFIKLLLFTAIPAAFVTGLPTRLLTHFDWGEAGIFLGGSLGAVLLARLVFHSGLAHYRSGALWTRA